jgi:hypothetical protein
MQIRSFSKEDMQKGAEWLHEKLDGLIEIPEKLAIVLAGIGSAVIPVLLIWLIWKGGTA